jgi:transglutaminase-like putative cysteine protease
MLPQQVDIFYNHFFDEEKYCWYTVYENIRRISMESKKCAYLLPTPIIDSDHEAIVAYAKDALIDAGLDPVSRAVKLYYAVRDLIWYDPYLPFYRPEHYRASNVLKKGRAFCIGKATLLCALGRADNIPSRVGFADVRNHLATKQLIEFLGSDLFVYHGFTEFYLNGKWCKATPAFNLQLCKRHKVIPLEFDGCQDSIFHPFNTQNKQFMEYVADHGAYDDVPVEKIVSAWKEEYGDDRIQLWIEGYEKSGGKSGRDFSHEEAL